jgi:hypothetical protein
MLGKIIRYFARKLLITQIRYRLHRLKNTYKIYQNLCNLPLICVIKLFPVAQKMGKNYFFIPYTW